MAAAESQIREPSSHRMQTKLRLCGYRLYSGCAGRHLRLSLSRLHYKPAPMLPRGLGFWAVLGVTGDTLACQPGSIRLHLADSITKSFCFFKAFHTPALLHQHNPCSEACSRKTPAQLLFPRCHREGRAGDPLGSSTAPTLGCSHLSGH